MPKFDIEVQLTGQGGNAFMVLGLVSRAMKSAAGRAAGVTDEDVKAFMDEAMSADYNHLLRTVMDYVHVA
jgi:hypothetical protein